MEISMPLKRYLQVQANEESLLVEIHRKLQRELRSVKSFCIEQIQACMKRVRVADYSANGLQEKIIWRESAMCYESVLRHMGMSEDEIKSISKGGK